jgi:hypothetical protein
MVVIYPEENFYEMQGLLRYKTEKYEAGTHLVNVMG